MRCEEFLDRLDRLQDGETDPEVERHTQECAACAELRALIEGMRTPQRDARPDLVARAMGIMPKRARLVARLFGSSLLGAGARSGRQDDFSLHAGVPDIDIHLQYREQGGTWTVSGRAPDAEWTLVFGATVTQCAPGGRFKFTATGLESTGFVLKKGTTEIEFPSAQELIANGS